MQFLTTSRNKGFLKHFWISESIPGHLKPL
nr:MAG TPA: hypothetical protein [Caudoviricetes sp.]DAT28735.1 MAG TPA: hypothetical protein [Caudoviricetes sp.]